MQRLVLALAVALVGCDSTVGSAVGDASPGPGSDAGPGTDGSTNPGVDAGVPDRLVLYVSGNAPNITSFNVADTGALTSLGATPAFAANPSFLAITENAVYAVSENNSRVGAYAVDKATGALTLINDAASGGSGPAHLSVDRTGKFVLVANYGDGRIASLPIAANGGVGAPTAQLAGRNAHLILTDPSNKYAFVPCLGEDYIAQYLFDATTGQLTPNAVPRLATLAGAGPRHLAFAPGGARAYLINEKNSTLSALSLDATTGRLSELQTVSTRAAGANIANTGAEIWVHPSGKFVYVSNRGDDNIGVFSIGADGRVTLAGHASTLGKTPRHFMIDPGGTRLYVANQGSNNVVPFSINTTTGLLTAIGTPVAATAPTFVGVVGLAR